MSKIESCDSKVQFRANIATHSPLRNPGLLQRTEIVALFNTLNRFTESLHAIERFRELYYERSHPASQVMFQENIIVADAAANSFIL